MKKIDNDSLEVSSERFETSGSLRRFSKLACIMSFYYFGLLFSLQKYCFGVILQQSLSFLRAANGNAVHPTVAQAGNVQKRYNLTRRLSSEYVPIGGNTLRGAKRPSVLFSNEETTDNYKFLAQKRKST